MNEIERNRQTEVDGRSGELQQLHDALPPELFSAARLQNNADIVSLVSVVRRPPELQLSERFLSNSAETNETIATQLEPLDGISTTDLAYAIAELVVRREPELRDLGDIEATRGLAALGNLARMYEHLFILQSDFGAHN